jgi:hypothetical protein
MRCQSPSQNAGNVYMFGEDADFLDGEDPLIDGAPPSDLNSA